MAENPWATAVATTGANPWEKAVKASGSNPWGKAAAASGASSSSPSLLERLGVPKVIDVLDRQRQTAQAAIAGDDPGRTFVHGAGPDQQDIDRAAVRKKLGSDLSQGDRDYVWTSPNGNKLPVGQIRQGIDDFALDTVTDPVTYETLGLGAFAKGIGRLGKAVYDAAKLGDNQGLKDAAKVANVVADKMTYGGSAKRELGEHRYNTAIGADNRQAAKEAEAARRLLERRQAAVAGLNPDEQRRVLRTLNGEEQLTDPVTGKLIVAPHVKAAHEELRTLTNQAAALQSDETALRKLGYNAAPLANARLAARMNPWELAYTGKRYADRSINSPKTAEMLSKMTHADDTVPSRSAPRRIVGRVDRQFQLPEDLREFQAPASQGIMNAENIRSRYLPQIRDATEDVADKKESTVNLLHPHAPNLIEREEFKVGDDDEDLPRYWEAFDNMLRGAARQGTAGRMREEIGVPRSFNAPRDSAMDQLFERTSPATGKFRTGGQIAKDWWKNTVSIPKNVVTGFGGKHAFINVPELARQSEGLGAARDALFKGFRYSRMSEADRYKALHDAVEGGVIAPFDDRANPLVEGIAKVPAHTRAAAGFALGGYEGDQRDPNADERTRLMDALVGGLGGAALGGGLPRLSKSMNNLTWAVDDAAKQAVLRRKLARGMDPADAAAQTMREMIDYRHKSDFTKALSYIAPFATFRSRLPAAIASGVLRTPSRALAGDRATQGLTSNGTVGVGPDNEMIVAPPESDVFGGIDQPQKYARATLSDPIRAALTLAKIGEPDDHYDRVTRETTTREKPDYFTYGQPLLPHIKDGKLKAGFLGSQLANYVPLSLGQTALQASGGSEFPDEDFLSELLSGVAGVRVR